MGGESCPAPIASNWSSCCDKVVEHLSPTKAHGVGFCDDGGGNHAFLDPPQRVFVGVHRQNDLVFESMFDSVRWRLPCPPALPDKRKRRSVPFCPGPGLCSGVESQARIAFHIYDPRDLDLRKGLKRVAR